MPTQKNLWRAWYTVAKSANWERFSDVKATYHSADRVGAKTVFDIGGNKYRIIAVIDYDGQKVFIRYVLNHSDYDKGAWKKDEFKWESRGGTRRQKPASQKEG